MNEEELYKIWQELDSLRESVDRLKQMKIELDEKIDEWSRIIEGTDENFVVW